ncbi:hypothetical protein A2U01_0108985, partial [Trifolium medium]|nr:hypothetical protein [Trifolium medium]
PAPCIESLPDKGGQTARPVECSGNGGASVCGHVDEKASA